MDLHSGGDLRYHIVRNTYFSEEQTKFFIACIIQGLSFVHKKLIIHRDIKPENLVFDSNGYLKITDFGIARIWS
jgi:serine/threonine protein kinase